MGTDKTKEIGPENGEEMERDVKEENIVDKTPMGSSAAGLEAGPEIDILKSAMNKYCSIPDSSLNDLKTSMTMTTVLFSRGK